MKSAARILVLVLICVCALFLFKTILHSDPYIPGGIPLGKDPSALAINPLTNEAVAVNEKSNTVSIVDLNIQQVTATIPVGREPKGIAIDNEMNIAVITNSKDDTVTLLDLNARQAITTIPVGKEPNAAAVNQNTHTAFVLNHKDGTVSVLDLMTHNVVRVIPVGKEPADIAIDPGLNIALVVNEKTAGHEEENGHYRVSIIDLNTYLITREVPVGKKPSAIDINPETHTAVVVNEKDNTITTINLLTWESRTIPVQKHPYDIAINPLDNRALVTSEEEETLQLIDISAGTKVSEYSINKETEAVAVNPYTNIAGVVDRKTNSLMLIQLPNPVPAITAISPDTIQRGSGDVTISIEGSRFITSSKARLDTYELTTTFINNNLIEAVVPEDSLLNAGQFSITVVTPAPNGGTSNSVNLNIENPAPTISAILPQEAIAGTPSLALNIYGTGFFNDTTIHVNGISRTFTYIDRTNLQVELTASDLLTGGYFGITASNPSPGGGESSPAVFTVLNPAPVLSSINPSSVTAGSPDIIINLTGENFLPSSTASFNSQLYPITYTDSTHLQITIPSSALQAAGDYPVTATNPAPGGGITTPLTFRVTLPLQIAITSPAEGTVTDVQTINIQGTVTSSYPITSVMVNGNNAVISGSSFSTIVNLIQGANIITAFALNSNGETAEASITVRYELPYQSPPVTPESGYIDGYVYDARTKTPLSGASITVAGITGETRTDNNGFFAFPVSDFPPNIPAKEVLLTAKKTGYTYGQRWIIVQPKTDVRADDIYLVLRDTVTTTITPDGGTATNSRGNIIVEFPAGAVDAPIEVNITEFDSSKELPGPLPETSHFTFAADFLPDGAVFNQPVHLKVTNFLGFPAGTPVPVGYYDKEKGAWVPDGMGVVSADGQWMEYDLTHFTPFDLNWSNSVVSNAPPPGGGNEGSGGDGGGGCGAGSCCGGSGSGGGAPGGGGGPGGANDRPASSIGLRSGALDIDHQTSGYTVLGKDFPLTLRYNSRLSKPQVFIGRTSAYNGFKFMPDLIKADIDFMGERKTGYYQPLQSELSFRAVFEPKDARGNELPTGIYPYVVTVTNRYDAVYYTLTREFGGYPEGTVFPIRGREPKYWSKAFAGEVLVRNEKDDPLGKGWSIDGVRRLIKKNDAGIAVIDGSSYETFGADSFEVSGKNIITTIAGEGQTSYSGVAVDTAGNIYMAESRYIRKVSPYGAISIVAGNGLSGFSGDGGPATSAMIMNPEDIAVDNAGNIYIADTQNHRIRKVDTNGTITTIAGTGQSGFSGDGGPATAARLFNPYAVAVDKAGNIYISDNGNYRIRKVSPGGIITTIAGTGQGGYSGDGGPAKSARLESLDGIAVDKAGNVYIANWFIKCIRKVDTNGIINTVAGICSYFNAGNSGDGGPATAAWLHYPHGVAADSYGNIYIADTINHRIRKVDTNGIITTVAGSGGSGFAQGGYSGDGGPASEALLKFPFGVTTDSAGNVYILDSANSRIRKVSTSYTANGTVLKSSKDNGTTLTANPDGTYTMRNKEGSMVQFSSEGLQTAVTDKNGNTTQYVYDTNQKLMQIIDPAGGTTVLNYTDGKLSSITDPQGRVTTVSIDANGDLTSITDPDGSVSNYNYDSSHLMTSKTLPGNKNFSYAYDSHGMVSSISLPDGSGKSYTHSTGMGLMNDITSTEASPAPPVITNQIYDEVVDELNNTTRYRTDRHGMSIETTDALGRTSTTERDKNSRPLKITQPDGSVITKTYDSTGNLLTETDALGNKTTYTYEPLFNQISTITDPKGNVTRFEYDAKGNLKKTTDPLSNITAMAYDAKGLLASVTDANGGIMQYQYDATGNLTRTIDQLGNTTTYTRDSSGNIASVTDAEGNITTNQYDSMNRLTRVTDVNGGVTSYTYTSGGCTSGCGGSTAGKLLSSITDARGNVTRFEYDVRDRQTKVINPDGTFTTKTYDVKGNAISQADENGNSTGYAYDAVRKLQAVTDPLSSVTGYSYDSTDNLSSVTDANGNTTTYEYDSLRRLKKTISPDTGTTTYTYDANGNMITKTDAKGIASTYAYDGLKRLLSISFPNPSDNVSYAYDKCLNGKGRLCSTADASGTTSYEYNARGQILKETKVIGGATYLTQYSYTPNGNLQSMIYPDGRMITYVYTSNRITSVTETYNGVTRTIVSDIAYDSISIPISITYGNRITADMTHDDRNRLSDLNIRSLKQLSYTRNNTGNITAITDALDPAKDKSYAYDSLSRLTQANSAWGSLNYGYDFVGNRKTETTDTGLTNYVYSSNKLTSSTGEKTFAFSYDNTGNTTAENNRQYTYNQNQRLIKTIENGVTVGEYIYNGNGQRIKKTVNGQTTIYHYSLDGQLIAESDNTGTISAEYVYLFNQPLAKIENNNVYYYHNDHLGMPMLMTDSSGNTVWQGEFKPFGESLSVTGSITNNLRFPGQYYDSETGLHYNWHRDYKPEMGRYLEADPIGIEGGINLYSYVRNNPINFVDPYGLKVQICYSPLSGLEASFWGIIFTHASVKANCGIFGFHPRNETKINYIWGPGSVRGDAGRSGLSCKDTGMTKCVDESCICNKIRASQAAPPYYGVVFYNCHSWAREIISGCQKECC